MENAEEGKCCKPEKSSSPEQDQTNIHMYPDWAVMQAYYGPRPAMSPFFPSVVASGHPHHPYMWAPPQSMMPPYAVPYGAIYAHGGVYAHPGVPPVATSLSMDTPGKSSGNTDQGLVKNLKGFNGLAMSIGNGNGDSGAAYALSQSGGTEVSTNGSEGNSAVTGQKGKRSHEEARDTAGNGKMDTESTPGPDVERNGHPEKVMAVTVSSAGVAQKVMGAILSPSMTIALEPRNSSSQTIKSSPSSVPQSSPIVPNEAWLQNEQVLKRERRKQSNRESARRSRSRKQAETEELAGKVEALMAENTTLKVEIRRLAEDSEKLKLENAKLMEKTKNSQLGQAEGVTLNITDGKRNIPVGTEDLLARVNNSGSVDSNNEKSETCDNKTSGAKLHLLLDARRLTNAMVAS